MKRFRLKNMPDDIWVIDEDTNKPLGYFFPPIPGECYRETFEPEQIVNLNEFPKLQNIKFFAIIYFNLGEEWQQHGFSIPEAWAWKHRGRTVQQAAPWHALGITYEEHIPWARKGCDAKEAKQWIDAGYQNPHQNGWLKLGIHYSEASAWINLGIKPQEAKEWRKAEFSPEDFLRWQEVNLTTAKEARFWRDYKKKTPEEFQTWFNPWKAKGFSVGTALSWEDEYGITCPEEASIWLSLNLEWDIVQIWKKYGYTPQQVVENFNNGGDLCPPEYYAEQ